MRYRTIFAIIGPFVLWSLWFTMLYGAQGIGCRANWDMIFVAGFPVLRVVLITMLLVATTISAIIHVKARRIHHGRTGIDRIGRYSTLAGVLSTILIFPGAFWLKLC